MVARAGVLCELAGWARALPQCEVIKHTLMLPPLQAKLSRGEEALDHRHDAGVVVWECVLLHEVEPALRLWH